MTEEELQEIEQRYPSRGDVADLVSEVRRLNYELACLRERTTVEYVLVSGGIRGELFQMTYEVVVNGKETGVEVVGATKREAREGVHEQWSLKYPNQPVPKRYRLDVVERVRV